MNNQNLSLYHIFYETAGCGNISAAARNLFISQPAVSKAISKLESNLGCSLFVRSSKGVSLTPEGELLYKKIELAFRSISQGEDQLLRNKELGVGQISIGVSTTLCKYVLLPYLQEFIKRYPHVKISIFCQSTFETIEGLKNGILDLGLVGQTDKASGLSFRPVQQIRDIFVTTSDYMEHLNTVTPSGNSLLESATLMLLDKKNVTRQYIDHYLTVNNMEPDQLLEVTTMDLLIEFAKIGMGVACVIGDFVDAELQDGTLIPFPVKVPIPKRNIGFAYDESHVINDENPALSKFLELITFRD